MSSDQTQEVQRKVFESGTVVGTDGAEQFVIDSVVDCGGEGYVYKAHAQSDGRVVAVKLLWKLVDVDESQRFERVREIHSLVTGKNVLLLEQAGILMDGEDKYPYFVFPFISGGVTMERVIEEHVANLSLGEKHQGTLISYKILLDVALELGNGLLEAHRAGVIHRDVKPSNVLVVIEYDEKGYLFDIPVVRLMDFGVAKYSEPEKAASDYKLTQQGCFRGTPAYLAPEAAAGRPSILADIWAYGAVLYEMVTGRTAFNFESGTMMSVLAKVVSGSKPPTPISEYCEDVPQALEALIMKCMSFKPEERPQSMLEVLGELNRMQLNLPHVCKSIAPPRKPPTVATPVVSPEAETMAASYTPSKSEAVDSVSAEAGLRKVVLNTEPTLAQKRLPEPDTEPRRVQKRNGLSTETSVMLVIGIAVAVVVSYFGYQTWKQQHAANQTLSIPESVGVVRPANTVGSTSVASAGIHTSAKGELKTVTSIEPAVSAKPVKSAKASASAEAPEPEKTSSHPKRHGRGISNTDTSSLAPGIDYIPGLDGP